MQSPQGDGVREVQQRRCWQGGADGMYDRRDTRDGKIRGGIYQEYPRYIPYHGYIPVYFVRYPRIMACRVCTRTAHDQVHCQYRLTWQSPMSKLAGSLGHLCWKTRTVIRRIRLRRHSNTRYMQYYNLNPGTTPPPGAITGRYGAMPGMRKWGVVYARYIPVYTSRGIWHGIYPGGHS